MIVTDYTYNKLMSCKLWWTQWKRRQYRHTFIPFICRWRVSLWWFTDGVCRSTVLSQNKWSFHFRSPMFHSNCCHRQLLPPVQHSWQDQYCIITFYKENLLSKRSIWLITYCIKYKILMGLILYISIESVKKIAIHLFNHISKWIWNFDQKQILMWLAQHC